MTPFVPPRLPRLRRWSGLIVVLTICLAALLAGVASATTTKRSAARVPQGFFGTVLGDPLYPNLVSDSTSSVFQNQMNLMVSSGVESVRLTFDWAAAQPYRTWSQVPTDQQANFSDDGVDNVPTNFTVLDSMVAAAASRHLTLLPIVIYAPGWDGQRYRGAATDIPRRDAPYANFAAALVKRYGPNGTFWQAFSPKVPITSWQIWNEPDVSAFWGQHPFAARYVALLKAARSAIKHQDPRAHIVLAGLANYSWRDLRSIYAVKGARSLFDVVALHPYTKTPQGVITILSYGRQVMRGYGDAAKPMLADEISWPSAKGKTMHNVGYPFDTTEAGQAKDVSQVLPLLAANRTRLNLVGVYYYTWAGIETPNGLAFNYSGLLKYVHKSFVRKPVFYSFRHYALGLERCGQKGTSATQCLKPF